MSALRDLFQDHIGPTWHLLLKGVHRKYDSYERLLCTITEGDFVDVTDTISEVGDDCEFYTPSSNPPQTLPSSLPFERTVFVYRAASDLVILSAAYVDVDKALQDINSSQLGFYSDIRGSDDTSVDLARAERCYRVDFWKTNAAAQHQYGRQMVWSGYGYTMLDLDGVVLCHAAAVGEDRSGMDVVLWMFSSIVRLWHVKNVTRQMEERHHLPRQARRALSQQGVSIGPIRHHTLFVRTPTETRDKEGNPIASGATIPLHKVRGHFADYCDRGLFGRIKGVFWVPAHFRGSANIGVVTKDYHLSSADVTS